MLSVWLYVNLEQRRIQEFEKGGGGGHNTVFFFPGPPPASKLAEVPKKLISGGGGGIFSERHLHCTSRVAQVATGV